MDRKALLWVTPRFTELIETVLAEINVSPSFPQTWRSISARTQKSHYTVLEILLSSHNWTSFLGYGYLTLSFESHVGFSQETFIAYENIFHKDWPFWFLCLPEIQAGNHYMFYSFVPQIWLHSFLSVKYCLLPTDALDLKKKIDIK